jgi:hypothetical protein
MAPRGRDASCVKLGPESHVSMRVLREKCGDSSGARGVDKPKTFVAIYQGFPRKHRNAFFPNRSLLERSLLMLFSHLRSPWGASLGLAAALIGTGAGAATIHRLAVSATVGSGGATTYLQSTASGSALQGEVASSAQTAIKIPFGVLGEYNAAGSTFGSGMLGISTTGYGVGAESLSKHQPSLLALNNSGGPGAQIFGENGGDAADFIATGGGYGIYVSSDSGNAITSHGTTNFTATTFSEDESTEGGYGESGASYSTGGIGTFGGNFSNAGGIGVEAESETATQGEPAIQAMTETDGTELFDAGTSDSNTGNNLSISTVLSSVSKNASGGVIMTQRASSDLQINGDIYLTGAIYTNCDDSVPYATVACGKETLAKTRSASGASYDVYTAKHANATIEDEGEAVLRNGAAHVALDTAFASVISKRRPYLVFTTPQGDTRGLYVTNRTSQGFDVRETSGGRSSLTFDYRIVAQPIGEENERMALSKPKTDLGGTHGRPAMSKALAVHQMLLKHIAAERRTHQAFRAIKPPASFVSVR